MIDCPLAVFAYSFPHQKTFDFLTFLKAYGFNKVSVIAAPKVHLAHTKQPALFSALPTTIPEVSCSELCQRLGYRYLEVPHNEVEQIREFLQAVDALTLAIIAGARILSREVIQIFREGVINFHPGKIPETSGLDSFYWMIENQVVPGTTVHFIDSRVDAGDEIFFHECFLDITDTPQGLVAKLRDNEKCALNRLIKLLIASPAVKREALHRPHKNQPLSYDLKRSILDKFENWKCILYRQQEIHKAVFEACEVGDIASLETILRPEFVNIRNHRGWTPLIVAAFNQQLDCVKYLLLHGADVNACNEKGTSVLMYAKTKLIHQSSPSIAIIEYLVEHGADAMQRDMFGKTIFNYLEDAGDIALARRIQGILEAIY